jgi:hypothetical protein
MRLRIHRDTSDLPGSPASSRRLRNRPAARLLALLAVAAAIVSTAYQVSSQSTPAPSQTQNFNKPILLPEANRLPDANAQMAMREQQDKKKTFEAANLERKKQITDDSARLLKLANDLKAEVDKTNKDTLSLSVIRKADEIERLAHNVKEKMKLTVGSN